jgi:hypothetical protein
MTTLWNETLAEIETEELNEYLKNFVAPVKGGEWGKDTTVCFHCGAFLAGSLVGQLFGGGFRWGLAHGHGQCSSCGWPIQAYHFNPTPSVTRFSAILCVHPDNVKEA